MNHASIEKILNSPSLDYSNFSDDELNKMYDLAIPVRYLTYEEKQLSYIALRDFSAIQKEFKARKEKLDVAS